MLREVRTVCQNLSSLLVRVSWTVFWSNQDLIFYDYKTELTRISSRSFITNFDW